MTMPKPPSQGSHAATEILPPRGWVFPNLREAWKYRDMLYLFVWRDFRVRYRQTLIGGGWAVIQPLLTMVIFSIIFGGLMSVPSNGIPYPIFSYAGLLPWRLFSEGVMKSSASIVTNGALIRKTYFPRLILPASVVLTGVVDFAIAFVILIVMMLAYGYVPTQNILWLPALIVLALAVSFGVGLWFAAFSAQFRDAINAVGFLLQIMLYATPVIYPSSLVSDTWRLLYSLNPLVGIVEGFRWALLGVGEAPGPQILLSVAVTLVILVSGLFYFGRVEQFFADIV